MIAHNNHLGAPIALTDSTGKIVWSANYDPFGAAVVRNDVDGDGNQVTLNVRNPGQYYDQETGLSQNGFRDYDAQSGKYLESDPAGLEGGLNTYPYVNGNPVNAIDPTGERATSPTSTCDRKKCKGKARVIYTDPNNHKVGLGKVGAFPPKVIHADSAAVAAGEQWGGKNALTSCGLDEIYGYVNGMTLFTNIADNIGGPSDRTKLLNQYPGTLLIEMPLNPHLGSDVVDIELNIPSCLSCPAGTTEVK